MEYLMSHGWAILIVAVVGVSLWQLGVLKPGNSTPPTSSGFENIKPMLATCKSGNYIWEGDPTVFMGFECQFVNVAGSDIVLTDSHITVDNEVCSIQVAQNIPQGIPGHIGRDFYTVCANTNPASCAPAFCANCYDGVNILDCGGPPGDSSFITIPKEGSIFAGIYRHANAPAENWGICGPRYTTGQSYSINFDFTYTQALGGVAATKHSSGTVHMLAG
jgi:hypothetical protein